MKNFKENLEFELLKNKLSNEVLLSELGELKNKFNDMEKAFNELISQSLQKPQQ